MEPRFLLDTHICIYIRQRKPPALLRRFERLSSGEAAISVITYGELLYGAEKSVHRTAALERLKNLILVLPALPLPDGAAHTYARIRADLESRGEVIGNNDLWIAAHAVNSKLILVTNNDKELRRLPELNIQNWAV